MDTTGVIQEHGKKKLGIYKQYLKNYLSVLIQSKWYSQIYIYDVCAGSGKDIKGTHGSALIAAQIINNHLLHKTNNSTWLKLFVNELDKQSFDSLNKELDQFGFIEYSNKDADDFLKSQLEVETSPKRQNLFFIDPFGYTQYSFNSLFQIASNIKKSEFLIFIPISSIVRFANSNTKQAKPVKNFLSGLGVNERITSNADLTVKVINALKLQFKTEFVYSYKLKNTEEKNSEFALFFISKHIIGAEKYLEAMLKVKGSEPELQLFDVDNKDLDLQAFINTSRSNHEIYHWSIVNGLLPKETNTILKSWQKSGYLEVLPAKTRKGAFYNSYQHSKKSTKVHIRYVGK